MTKLLKFLYITILYVFLLLIVEADERKLILILFILCAIFQSFLVIFIYCYFTLQKSVLLTTIVKNYIRNGLWFAWTVNAWVNVRRIYLLLYLKLLFSLLVIILLLL